MSAPNEDTKEEGRDALVGRELASSVNTEQLLQEHAQVSADYLIPWNLNLNLSFDLI